MPDQLTIGRNGTKFAWALLIAALVALVLHGDGRLSRISSANVGGDFLFTDVTALTGLDQPLVDSYVHAAAWGDIDGDGWQDLFTGTYIKSPTVVPNKLFRNDDGVFGDTGQLPIEIDGRASGVVFADLDNDGDLDLYVSNNRIEGKPLPVSEPSRLYRNDDGVFVDVTDGSGIDAQSNNGRQPGVLDYNGDGLLDLLVVADNLRGSGPTTLFENLGGLTFADATAGAGIPGDIHGLGLAIGDLTGNGWSDIFVAGEPDQFLPNRNFLLIAEGDGTYHQVTADVFDWTPFTLGNEDWVSGAAVADLNRDGRLDLVVGHHFGSSEIQGGAPPIRLYMNRSTDGNGDPVFDDITAAAGLPPTMTMAPHVDIQDFDNDGWPDIYASLTVVTETGPQPLVFRNEGLVNGDPVFTSPVLDTPHYYAAGPVADFNNDGRQDVFLGEFRSVLGNGNVPSILFRNDSAAGNWIDVMVATQSNRFGIGAQVRVYRAGMSGDPSHLLGAREITAGYGFSSAGPPIAHFGIGAETSVDIVVELPHGQGQFSFPEAGANARHHLSADTPPRPAGLFGYARNGSSIALLWNQAHADSGVTSYRVLKNGLVVGETSETDFVDSPTDPGVGDQYEVVALDGAGNGSEPSLPFVVNDQLELPPGFARELVTMSVARPTKFKFGPGGRLFVSEKSGLLHVFGPDGEPRGTYLDLTGDITTNGSRGLQAVAFDPQFDQNGFLYVFYTAASGDNRISRFKQSQSDPDSVDSAFPEEVLIELTGLPGWHNGGAMAFGPDGYLYASTGDSHPALSGEDPQSLESLNGKILRLDTSGAPSGSISDDFSSDTSGDYTFTYLGGAPNPGFSVVDGALRFSRVNRTGGTGGIAIHDTEVALGAADMTAEVTIVQSDSGGASTGPIVRATDGSTWYGLRARAARDTIAVLKSVDGARSTVGAEFAVPVSPGDTVALKVSGSGPVTLEVFLNGVSLGTRIDSSDPIIQGSHAGIWTKTQGNGTNRIDDFAASGSGSTTIVPGDNPFVGIPGAREEIYALGFRNPFSLDFDPVTGDLMVVDVGIDDNDEPDPDLRFEEVNLVVSGGNYGWDVCSGPCGDPASYVDPAYFYSHAESGDPGQKGSVVGAAYYRGAHLVGFDGDFLFGDYVAGFIRRLHQDGTVDAFATGVDNIVDIRQGPDGAIYYMSHTLSGDPSMNDGAVFRIDTDGGEPSGGISDDFSSDTSGDYTFTYLGGAPNPGFSVVDGALRFSRVNRTGGTGGIAIHDTEVALGAADMTAEVTIVQSDSGGASTGPIVRATDGSTWYGLRARAARDTIAVLKSVDGARSTVGAEFAVPVSPGDTVALKVSGSGPVTLEVFLNGVSLGTRIDSSDPIIQGSHAGIWTKTQGNGTNRIDDFAARTD